MKFISINSTGYIIGLYTKDGCKNDNQECRDKWQWRDGSNYENYRNWEDGKPDDKNHECARLKNTGVWRNMNCGDRIYKFICKKKGKIC